MNEQSIFTYFNGVEKVSVDPWPIYRDIFRKTGGRPNELANKIRQASKDAADVTVLLEANEASEILEKIIRDVFKMVPFDGTTKKGATWPVCFRAWKEFGKFMADLKKKIETNQNSISPSDSQESTPQTTASGLA